MMTRTGVTLGVAAAVMLSAGVWADYPEWVMLGLVAAAALVVAALWMVASPRLDAVREIHPYRVQQGEPAQGVVTVNNTGRRRSPPLVVTESVADQRITVPVPGLAAGSSVAVTYSLPTGRRGRYVLPPMVVGRSDPLRLMQMRRACGEESVLFVHPVVHPVGLATLGGSRDGEGPTSSSSPQGGAAFHSLRDYQPGDDWRHIHWPSTARTQSLMVRHTVIPDDPRHLFVLDTSVEPYDDESFEDAVRVAASWCVAASRAGLPFNVRTTGDVSAAFDSLIDRWDSEVTDALDRLSGVERSDVDRGLLALTDLVHDVVSPDEGVTLGIVTGHADPVRMEVLAMIRPRFTAATIVHIGRPEVVSPVVPGGVLSVTAGTSVEFAAAWNQLVLP